LVIYKNQTLLSKLMPSEIFWFFLYYDSEKAAAALNVFACSYLCLSSCEFTEGSCKLLRIFLFKGPSKEFKTCRQSAKIQRKKRN